MKDKNIKNLTITLMTLSLIMLVSCTVTTNNIEEKSFEENSNLNIKIYH